MESTPNEVTAKREDESAERLLIEQIDPTSLDPDRMVRLSGHPDRVLAELRKRYLAGKSTLLSDLHVEDPGLLLTASDSFPSYHAALLQAGVPLQGARDLTKSGVLSELGRCFAAGLSIDAGDVEESDPALYAAVQRIFGRWGRALAAAGISGQEQGPARPPEGTQPNPQAPAPVPSENVHGPVLAVSPETPSGKRQYIRWTESKLLDHIREAAAASKSLLPKDMFGPNAGRIVGYCKDKFGSYAEALKRSGLDAEQNDPVPDAVTPPASERDRLMQSIAAFVEEPWDQESVVEFRRRWGKQVKAMFGGWSQVATELNIPEWKLSSNRLDFLRADPDLLLDLLRDRYDAGEPVDSASLRKEDRELWQAIVHCFGDFDTALLKIV